MAISLRLAAKSFSMRFMAVILADGLPRVQARRPYGAITPQ
jgi:hypothetical protein